MRCHGCGSLYVEKKGNLTLQSCSLGRFTLNNVSYFACPECGSQLLPNETWHLADQEENSIIQKYIEEMPVKKFISTNETATLLGITRQALHKHKKIKRGFIYSITISEKKMFNKKSVILFKETGDGRFNLVQDSIDSNTKYIFLETTPSENKFIEHGGIQQDIFWDFFESKSGGMNYAKV